MTTLTKMLALALLFVLAGCAEKRNPIPARQLTLPDKALLMEIAHKAIQTRLPSVRSEDLKLDNLAYRYSLDDLDNSVREQFDVEFSVAGSKRQVEEDGRTLLKIDWISVDIELDGQIGKGGVDKGTETLRSSDLRKWSSISHQGGPIWGESFYPVKLDAPLPKPDRAQLKMIALDAISRFVPTVHTTDLDLCSVTFTDMRSTEDGLEFEGFQVTFWIKSSVRVTDMEEETKIDRDEVTVIVSPAGHVERSGVSKSPGSGTYFKRKPK